MARRPTAAPRSMSNSMAPASDVARDRGMATGFYSQRRTWRDPVRCPVRNLVAFFAVISVLGACQAGPAAQPVTTPAAELTPTISTSSTPQAVESSGPTLAAVPTTALAAVTTTAIAVGNSGACALRSDGSVACWYEGNLTAVPVPGIHRRDGHRCGRRGDVCAPERGWRQVLGLSGRQPPSGRCHVRRHRPLMTGQLTGAVVVVP